MSCRYLVGPLSCGTSGFPDLRRERLAQACLTFGPDPGVDVVVGPSDTWDEIVQRLPGDWRPDFLVLHLPYTNIPCSLWTAPLPLVALAGDWHLLWHSYRHRLARCDLILTDARGVQAFQRQGLDQARPGNLLGRQDFPADLLPGRGERDIDVLFAGSIDAAVDRERLPWLGRLARFGDRWRIQIRTDLHGQDDTAVLERARVVFHRSSHGECDLSALAAAACGALLFQEQGNLELPAYLAPGTEYVAYTDDTLETLLEHYLEHEDQRRHMADTARERLQAHGFDQRWERMVQEVERELPVLRERATRRSASSPVSDLPGRIWQAWESGVADPMLAGDLAAALVHAPGSAALHHGLGTASALAGRPPAEVAGCFQRAVLADPRHAVAGLNLAEALAAAGDKSRAIDQARHVLALVNGPGQLSPEGFDAPHFSSARDVFGVEWERAAWMHAGSPAAEVRAKRELLCWRLHSLLAAWTGEERSFYEAALARPDVPATRAALGCALGRAGRPIEAIPHLRAGVDGNPFDPVAVRALFQALGDAGDGVGQRRLAAERRRLQVAAPQAVAVEPWVEKLPPPGDELASLILLCCNQVAYTRLCLESVLQHTRTPYELILVDNGSSDETPAYLKDLRARSGPARVVVLRNPQNRGFAAGCNQALPHARGHYLVFLNNDTVVTPGWLDGLISGALSDWPHVGLVGPVSNVAPPPQWAPGAYRDLAMLEGFATRHARAYAGRALTTERLTGFCLLLRREVLKQVGGFDEAYGLGFFEDDDLCVRARQAGFGLLVAQGVYIHHFGSRTFAALGIDTRQQLQANLEQFKAKWGEERAAGYRLPEDAALVPVPVMAPVQPAGQSPIPSERPRVSLCMIVKNEEDNLSACLASVRDVVDEMVIVDTGSTDRTKEVAARWGARVLDFPWCDSFAAARNVSLQHATGDWAFWLDADDRLDEDNRQKLKELFAGLTDACAGYSMKCLCLPEKGSASATVVDHVRLFRRHPQVCWRYRVHEQILPAIREQGGEVREADVVIQHTGYQDAAHRRAKDQRNVRLLEMDLAENPNCPFTLFNLGWTYEETGEPAKAATLLEKSLALSNPGDSIVRKLYALLMQCHRQMQRPDRALDVCRQGREVYPHDAQLLFQEALLLRQQGDLAGAEACLLRLLNTHEPAHFASTVEGLRGYQARHNLAVIYHEQGRHAEAEAQWRQALGERPTFGPAWLGLGETLLAQGRRAELAPILCRLDENPEDGRGIAGAAALRARAHLAERQFAEARQVLEAALAHSPQDVLLRSILSHAYLQEDANPGAAEGALRDVLALDPQHPEARQNLAVLLRRQGRLDEARR